jgi:cyclopropane-fatty-acyl-phospholipid synthase
LSCFSDRDIQYSCAYFTSERESLEDAQANKTRRVAAKLLLAPDMRVLDIGCGFGGLALNLTRWFGVEVVGLTLSEELDGIPGAGRQGTYYCPANPDVPDTLGRYQSFSPLRA